MQDTLFNVANNKQRLTQAEKNANNKQWYQDQADLLDRHSFSSSGTLSFGGVSDFTRKKVNYDLFNDIIKMSEFEYVCKPFGNVGGGEIGSLPANFANRDIVSGKIKVLLGMEMKMPFSWKIVATNEEATTRKEQEEFGRIKNYVINEIMRPIRLNIEKQKSEENKGQKLTPEEQQQIQQEIEEETQAQTPDEVRKYMTREHQDPSEVMSSQLLEYLLLKEDIANKFNKGFKHLMLSGTEVFHVGIYNGEPGVTTVNSLYFDHDMSPDLDYIEDGEWGVAEYNMTPSEVLSKFSSELKEDEIDRIYEYNTNPSNIQMGDWSFDDRKSQAYTVKVRHCAWKSLQKIGFLQYFDTKTGEEELMIVDENYKINKKQGDISIQWEWIPEAHECYKILNDIYVYARPVQGQSRDLDNLYICKLPFYGASVDCLNSPVTAPMDRMKNYQYLYDIIIYRIELLMASDKGKILIANVKSIPKSSGIDTKKFMYFLEANKIGFLNPNEEGNRGTGGDITNMVKEIDMSLASDIMKYISIADYIERKCGASIGVTPQMEAQIGPDEAVTNTKQNLVQSSHIIQPYFELHNTVKGNVLQAVVENAKVAYSTNKPRKLSYVLDDMSTKMLTTNPGMLQDSTLGLFVSRSSKAEDAKQAIMALADRAMQSQQVDLLDVIKVINAPNVQQAQEDLEVGQAKKQEQMQAVDKQKMQNEKDAQLREDTQIRDQWAHDERMIVVKEEQRRITEVQKSAELALGMEKAPETDILDIMEHNLDDSIRNRKEDREDEQLQLDKDKFSHQKVIDHKKVKIDEKKANKPKST